MAINDYKDLDCEANGMTTPQEKAKLRTEVEKLSVTELMQEFWRNYEAGQNYGVTKNYDLPYIK